MNPPYKHGSIRYFHIQNANYHLTVLLLLFLCACQNSSKRNTLTINLKNSNPQKIYLYQAGTLDNAPLLIDSIFNSSMDAKISLELPNPDKKIYQLIVSPYLSAIYFVNDTFSINIDINLNNYIDYKIDKGKANKDLVKLHTQNFPLINLLSNHNITEKERNQLLEDIEANYLEMSKKTMFPEVALFAASQCNFENDIEKIFSLLSIFTKKFPTNINIQNYISLSNKFINSKTKEYHVGDTMPNMVHIDLLSKDTINTQSNLPSFVIYDFFSVVRRNPSDIKHFEETIKKFGRDNVKIYSFPVDPDSAMIHQFIKKSKVDWPHFSDYLGWQGEIIPKYYIDSVPYLFVTDVNGIIVHKNIPINELVKSIK